jgi:hypothetical protein
VSAPREISNDFARYFAEERRRAAFFLAAGLAALTLSLVLAARPTAYRGMIPPLGVLGLVEIVVGATVFLRTPRQAGALRRDVRDAEEDARARERERIRRVIASFRIYKVAETVVLTAGLTLMMLFPRHTVLYASGLGCLLQASVLLVLDRVAERRAREYASALDATCWRGPGPDRA